MPCELGNWGDRADEGVLVAFEAGVFLQTEDGAISEDGLVQNLPRICQSPLIDRRGYKLTCKKYTQTRMTKITESVLRRILLL